MVVQISFGWSRLALGVPRPWGEPWHGWSLTLCHNKCGCLVHAAMRGWSHVGCRWCRADKSTRRRTRDGCARHGRRPGAWSYRTSGVDPWDWRGSDVGGAVAGRLIAPGGETGPEYSCTVRKRPTQLSDLQVCHLAQLHLPPPSTTRASTTQTCARDLCSSSVPGLNWLAAFIKRNPLPNDRARPSPGGVPPRCGCAGAVTV